MRPQRGLTFITVLILLAFAGAVFWLLSFGEAYWEDQEVKGILRQAANVAYNEKSDEGVKDFVFRKLHDLYDEKVEDHGRIVTRLKLDVSRDDLQVERSQLPPRIDIWLTYSRTVNLVLVGQPRTVTFNHHVTQDLSQVKW